MGTEQERAEHAPAASGILDPLRRHALPLVRLIVRAARPLFCSQRLQPANEHTRLRCEPNRDSRHGIIQVCAKKSQ
ncbi:unnamed protein product, partial [Iphiclides podalirius]